MAKGIKVVANKGGYRALLGSAEVQGDVQRRADAIARSAESKLSPDWGRPAKDPHFTVEEFHGTFTTGRTVFAHTEHAKRSQSKSNTLLNSLDAGR